MAPGVISMNRVRYRIKALAAEKGISMARLSRAADIDQSNLYNLSNGKTEDVKMSTLQTLARILECPVVALIEEYDDGLPDTAAS